jgi:hypothetical protein
MVLHISSFFFLELRRRAARHFIKVEKTVHESRRNQTRVQRTNTHHTSRTNLETRHKEQEKNDHRPKGLSTNGQQPGRELLELWSPCWTLETTLHAHSPQHHLKTRSRILEHTIIKELRPLRASFGTALITFLHHPEKRPTERSGANCTIPRSWKIETQTWRANTQPTKRWLIVSSAWSQRGQTSGCGRPCFAKLSAVQHRLWTTNQMKNLQRRGAQLFQILLQGLNLIVPMKKAE